MGEWFSLPHGGHCTGGAAPDGKACTWRATRVKTIDSKCLFEQHGYVAKCAEGAARAPFKAAEVTFGKAFAAVDPAKGGCPALPGPERM